MLGSRFWDVIKEIQMNSFSERDCSYLLKRQGMLEAPYMHAYIPKYKPNKKKLGGKLLYPHLSLKCKISAVRLVGTACIFLIFLIATVQISMECETQESEAGYTKKLNLY